VKSYQKWSLYCVQAKCHQKAIKPAHNPSLHLTVGLVAFIDAVRLSERVAAFRKRCRPCPPQVNSTVMPNYQELGP
jgi:hypothetical protein